MPSGGNFTNCNCGPDTPVCASPTEPVATVGLCLADGTPIAVTVVRDCAGTITSEGWINLTTVTWSAGAPPAGTIACGDSRSIQVSGTFCDIDDDGQVLGLVLIEYAYAADGSIDGVRLVDAVTGDTYIPQGEVTTCPAGVEQPERDLVQLCDTNDDESGAIVTVPFLRDYARDENGVITGHSDYTLDGQPYTVSGTAGICPEPSDCRDCQTLALCDTPLSTTPAPLLASGTGRLTGTTESGVGWTTSSGTNSTVPNWFPLSMFPVAATGPFVLTLDRPGTATWSARVGISGTAVGRLIMPAGTELVSLSPLHLYDPVTRTLSHAPGAGTATDNGESTFTHRGPISELTIASDGTGGLAATQRSVGLFFLAQAGVPFLRTTCRDCDGLVLDSTDTLLDGATPYEPTGVVGVCHPPQEEPCASTVTTLRLCDLNPDVEPDEEGKRCATPFLRHLVYDCTGALAETRDTAMDGVTAYTAVEVVDCGSGGVPAMVEVPWEVTGIAEDPEAPAGRGFLFSLSPIDDPDTVGVVKVTTTTTANTVCASTPPAYGFSNPCTYTYTPDAVLRDQATYVRVDLRDFDNFEPVSALVPPPDRLGGTAYWSGSTVLPTVNNLVGEMFYDGPPETWRFRIGNTGGGISCSSLSFVAVSLRAEGCCAPCGNAGGGGGRTVQEVCVVTGGAGAPVMTWTRVIENDGATIYYLDEDGVRHDGTLPSGHRIVPCPESEPEPCRDTATVLLCDDPAPDGVPPVTVPPTITDTDPTPFFFTSHNTALPGGGQALWDGSPLLFPAEPNNSATGGPQVHRCIAGYLQAPAPECHDGTATVNVSVDVQNLGPNGAVLTNGRLRLLTAAGVQLANVTANNTGAGTTRHLAITAAVDPALADAGELVVWVDLETWDQSGSGGSAAAPKSWEARNFTASVDFGQAGCVPATQFLRTLVTDCETGAVLATTDTTLDGAPYEVTGEVGQCTTTGSGTGCCPPTVRSDTELLPVCFFDADGALLQEVLAEYRYDTITGARVQDGYVDLTTGDPVEMPPGATVGYCHPKEPCTDSSTQMLCDTAAQEPLTVFDPANRPGSDGWEVVSYTTVTGNPAEGALPYDAPHPPGSYMGARTDLSAGTGPAWPGYDAAPHRWVLRKTVTAPEDGIAVVSSVGFRGDGGARVRVNGQDAGMYGQWNQPATSGTAQIPVTAGPNIVEIEVRDGAGNNWVTGRLDIVMTRTVQFMRRTVVDCETGATTAVVDTTLDGEPYEVTGEVGRCEAAGGGECCEPAPPEQRLDVETLLLCVRDEATGDILTQVIAERVYDDQSGDRIEQRLTTLDGEPYEVPAGAELTKCPSPDRITRQVCVVESGSSEFLTNEANATSGQDTDWVWAPTIEGAWYPMYRVAPNPIWSVQDTAPNPARWVAPHASRSVCSPNPAQAPNVTQTWFTRASWNLPADADPASIRIAATIMNGDNGAVQWRLNDGPWQPIATGGLSGTAWSFPPTAVPGGRAGQNEIIIQQYEGQPGVTCPSPNEGGMIMHVYATYDHAPKVWTQVIEPGGQSYYLDENGARQDAIPEGSRIVPCGGSGETVCCTGYDADPVLLCDTTADEVVQFLRHVSYADGVPTGSVDTLLDGQPYEPVGEVAQCVSDPCTRAFSTECVGAVTRTEAAYDNTSLINGVPGQCGSVQGPDGQFPCQPATGGYTITSWIVDGEEVIAEGGGRAFAGGPCGEGTAAAPGMHRSWSEALTNLDPSGASWSAQNAPGCAWFIGSSGGTRTVYGAMTVRDQAGRQWVLGPAQSCDEVQFTKVYTQDCDGAITVSWLDAEGAETTAPEGALVPCGTGCSSGGGRGTDIEVVQLCDLVDGADPVPFLRHIAYDTAGQVAVVTDTGLDGFAPYAPSGTVTSCQPEQAPDIEVIQFCDILDDGDPVPFLRHIAYPAGPTGLPAVTDTLLDGVTPYAPAGTVGTCAPAPEDCPVTVVEECRYDDTDGDGIADEMYVELIGVACDGTLTPLGTYTPGLTGPYSPVAPVDPPQDGPDPVVLVEPHRVELAPGQSWSAASVPLLQSVTATAHGGTGQIVTAGGTSTLFDGESVSWSVIRDGDTSLTGPLTITGGPGTVTVSYTRTTTS